MTRSDYVGIALFVLNSMDIYALTSRPEGFVIPPLIYWALGILSAGLAALLLAWPQLGGKFKVPVPVAVTGVTLTTEPTPTAA